MNGFVSAHLAADGVAGQYTMAYFERDDIPFHWALADAFTVCDGYHCSMLGPTWPNRLYLMTGTVDPGRRRRAARSTRTTSRPRASPGRPTRSC